MQPRLSTSREDLNPPSTSLIVHSVSSASEIPANTLAQKKAVNEIANDEKKLVELEQIYSISTDSELRLDISKKIVDVRNNINNNKEKIVKLQRNARYAQKCKDKKKRLLIESQEVVQYDKPGRPPLLFEHLNLYEHIHNSVESEVVKVRIIKNLCKSLEENYNVYMARTTLNNYLLPRQANSIATRAYHHPAWVAVSGVSRTETQDHPDGHYCLVSVKCAKQFASLFANVSVIISQDDKAKVGLGVPAVSRTFSTLQSINELVKVADHDFPAGFSQLLVPSVYLMIKPNETNDELRTGQIAIFVHCQWSFGTSSLTHMQDLQCLTQDPQYDEALKTNSEIRPI
ncbi:34497_t:CDS:2 [Gigaspora margarita]|uniref:34497_t:CDS:1 n=1 Tax=Gigaspora margarita TaxID=4874 RepID=A0ABN7VKA8_GIGMA|nr:34497_t:CDS:2 [Gigaspora margarita]